MKSTDPPIIVSQTFDVSVERVWEAITLHDQMTQWFFENIPSFKPEIGFETRFIVQSEERTFTHQWKVLDVEPNQEIRYEWTYAEYPGKSNVIFTLNKNEGKVRLQIATEVLENFPDNIPEFTTESCTDGWNYFLCLRLKEYLAGAK